MERTIHYSITCQFSPSLRLIIEVDGDEVTATVRNVTHGILYASTCAAPFFLSAATSFENLFGNAVTLYAHSTYILKDEIRGKHFTCSVSNMNGSPNVLIHFGDPADYDAACRAFEIKGSEAVNLITEVRRLLGQQ